MTCQIKKAILHCRDTEADCRAPSVAVTATSSQWDETAAREILVPVCDRCNVAYANQPRAPKVNER